MGLISLTMAEANEVVAKLDTSLETGEKLARKMTRIQLQAINLTAPCQLAGDFIATRTNQGELILLGIKRGNIFQWVLPFCHEPVDIAFVPLPRLFAAVEIINADEQRH